MTAVLVTGATGFVGGHALDALAARPEVRPVAACRDPARLPAGFAGEVRVRRRGQGAVRTTASGAGTACCG